jgi:hypothetical protein
MGLEPSTVERLEEAELVTAGRVMEWLIVEGDESLLTLAGIEPETLERIKETITELALLEAEPVPTEEAGAPEVAEEAEAPVGDEERQREPVAAEEEEPAEESQAEMLEKAMQGGAESEERLVEEEDVEEGMDIEDEDEEYFFEDGEPLSRDEKLKRERRRRVQLVYDEETGELVPRRRRKRAEDAEDWREYIDF